MQKAIDPALYRDLSESKAALARHGIVIIRSIEADLGPAMISATRDSISASPEALSGMSDEELDEFMEGLRKTAMKSAKDLRVLYIRLLAQLGTEYIGDLVKELDGIEKLFTWERVSKSVDPINKRLAKAGFRPMRLPHAEAVSASFALELNERWPTAFDRFKGLACEAAKKLEGDRTKTTPKKKSKKKTTPKKTKKSGNSKKG
ncbi:MAG: hypothetical protein OEM29_04060 [Thermoplasmata archaeon]|nr:hypothetical protein [Thermoplasmata archaeon]